MLVENNDPTYKVYNLSKVCAAPNVWVNTTAVDKDATQDSATYTCAASCIGNQIKAKMSTALNPTICLDYKYKTYSFAPTWDLPLKPLVAGAAW